MGAYFWAVTMLVKVRRVIGRERVVAVSITPQSYSSSKGSTARMKLLMAGN
jgi:hypothetical protein